MKTQNSSMQSDPHRPPPYRIRETPASKRRRLGGWAIALSILLLALGFYIMPGSRNIMAENMEALGFSLAMLGLAVVILGVFLVSRREERIAYRLFKSPES